MTVYCFLGQYCAPYRRGRSLSSRWFRAAKGRRPFTAYENSSDPDTGVHRRHIVLVSAMATAAAMYGPLSLRFSPHHHRHSSSAQASAPSALCIQSASFLLPTTTNIIIDRIAIIRLHCPPAFFAKRATNQTNQTRKGVPGVSTDKTDRQTDRQDR
jgi:hypothetical protein